MDISLFVFNSDNLKLLKFPDVELNPGPRAAAPVRCRLLCCNIRGLHCNIKDLTVASSGFDVIMCSETFVSRQRHMSELRIPGFSRPVQLYRDSRPRVRGMAVYVRDGFSASLASSYSCNCCEMQIVRVCGGRMNFYVFSLYRNPDIDDHIFDCLVSSMSSIQEADRRAAFIFTGDLIAHHAQWLGSARTDGHGVAARDFADISGCEQMVTGPTHLLGGTLDLLLTDVPDLVNVSVKAPIGGSDHSSLSIVVTTNQIAPAVTIRKRVLLKTRVNWDNVSAAVVKLPWLAFRRSRDPIGTMNAHIADIVDRFVPSRVIVLRSRDEPWFDDSCRTVFELKQSAYHRWSRDKTAPNWDSFREAQARASVVYSVAEEKFNKRAVDVLRNTDNSHKWWSTLKSSVFGVDPSLPPLIGDGGSLVSDPVAKANLLVQHFDSKQLRDPIVLPSGCHPHPVLTSFAFRSSEVLR